MYGVLINWIIKPDIGSLNMVKYLGDKSAMAKASTVFPLDPIVC